MNGTPLFCVDYMKLNINNNMGIHYLTLMIYFDTLLGLKWFSAIDLASGNWKFKVDPVDRDKTLVPFDLYQFV